MKKRILSIVLVLCMVLSFVPITVFAAGGDKTVSLGTDVIKNPTAPTASTDTWKGSYVYFGTYGGNPVKYRVLDKNTTVFGGTTMLLDCDSILWAGRNPSSAFDDNSNDWANSNIRTYLNGTFLTSNFSTAEQNAIASSTKSAEYSTDGNGWIGTLSYASLSNDKIFFLDAKEATNTSYGYSNNAGSAANREKTGGNAVWWLRSAYTFDANYAGMVYPGGGLGKGVLGKYVGVSPALNINLSSVLFTSAAEGGKADTAVDGDLTAVSDYTGSEWKLTLLDSSRDSFSISGATVNNGTIRFSYSGAQTGTNEYISAVVVESGTITHYGRIFQLDGTTYGANGTASLSLPAGVTLSENTKLYVFNEQYNGDYQTDYASALKVVLPQETTPNATFTATGDNDGTLSNVDTSMKYSVDGGTTWNAVTGTTMDISSVTAEKDVKVYKPGNGTTTVDSEVQTIDVTQAVQPTGVDKADCTTSQQNDGQITGVDTTMEYRLSGTSGWTAVTVNPVTGLGSGSYEVRVKASGTVLASGTVIVTIGAHTCVAQGDWQHDGTSHWKLCACGAKVEEAAHSGGTATCTAKAVCAVCDQPYGETDNTNHNLENIPAKPATVTETGNIEYWHCTDCGKYFSDENGENEIKLDDTVIAKLPPEIIEGKGQSVTEGEKKELSFTSNAAFSDFIRVELDGKTLDEKNYTKKEGSILVTLKADYVASLSAGEHTIGIVSESGTATTTFTVNAKAVVDNDTKSPQTGDNSHMELWIALLFVSGAGVIGTTVYGKKKRAK